MSTIERLTRECFDAVLFDTDGVITDTASVHADAWKSLFDAWLQDRAKRERTDFEPFDINADYRKYVDGKPRYDGVKSFLASRGIELPLGTPDDPPDRETVCALGNRKDEYFNAWLQDNRVRVFPGTLEFVHALRDAGVAVAAFSASRNMDAVLDNAGVSGFFDTRVDGRLMAKLNLPGKPDPAILNTAADRLGVPTGRCAVVEDAIAGVEAGQNGGAAFVIGIDRGGYGDALRKHGADLVVEDLSECAVDQSGSFERKRVSRLDAVWTAADTLMPLLRTRRVAVLLDYDGTLTPIVDDYRMALLSDSMRATLDTLSRRSTVAVISGRDLGDVRRLVGLDSVYYSGSHGYELAGPDDWHYVHERAAAYLPALDRAERELADALAGIEGHVIERKRFSIAVHYRQVEDARTAEIESAVDRMLADTPTLKKGLGKKVFELKPALQWDKGRAVELLLGTFDMHADDSVAIYIGDDLTDEAVFRVLRHPNVSIVIDDDDRVTSADRTLADCDDVKRFLEWLVASTGAAGQ